MTLSSTIPALPVRSVARALEIYRDKLGFTVVHADEDEFAIVVRDAVEIHLWQAGDEGWRLRPSEDLADCPVRTGAEDFIAGTASCRIACDDVDGRYTELAAAGVRHSAAPGWPVDTDYGTREVSATDLDGNLLTFFVRLRPR